MHTLTAFRRTSVLVLAVLLGAGCSAGGGDSSPTPTSPGGTPSTPAAPAATAGVNDARVKILATSLPFPYNVITDGVNVYWIDAETGAVGSVSTSSGATGTYIAGGGVAAGFDLAQDATNIYFTLNNFSLRKVPKAGGAVTILTNASTGPSPSGVIVVNGRVLFGNYGSGNGASSNSGPVTSSTVMSISTTGTGLAPLALNSGVTTAGVVLASNGTNVYFGYNGSVTGNFIRSVPVAGGNATGVVSGVGALTAIVAPATGAGAGSVYFAERAIGATSETLRRITGTTISVLATINTQFALSIAADDSFIYYPQNDAASGGSVIAKQSLTTGVVTILAGVNATNGIPAGLAVDGTNVYWAAVTGTSGRASIRSVPKS